MKVVVAVAMVVACSHAQPAPESAAANPQPASKAEAAPTPPPSSAAAAPTVTVPTGSIYFDFDSADLKPQAEEFLTRLGEFMAKYPDVKLRIEGNCDERGSEEYNIALGQRRADAAKKYLVRIGARDGQITTVSYGEDRPRAKGHDEESWRQNRRDDFIPDRGTVQEKPVSENG